jgi:PAS domain S-box-containing protein
VSVSEPLVQATLLGEAIDGGPALVLVADEEMNFVAVNQHACELLGYDREEFLRLSVPQIARYPEAAVEFREMVATGRRCGSTVFDRKDGSRVAVRYQASQTKVAHMSFFVCIGFEDSPQVA